MQVILFSLSKIFSSMIKYSKVWNIESFLFIIVKENDKGNYLEVKNNNIAKYENFWFWLWSCFLYYYYSEFIPTFHANLWYLQIL